MAIFKILKGSSSRIDFENTPFTEGYAYFTPDDAGFYIDTVVSDTPQRIRINPKSRFVSATLLASGWVSGLQTINIQGVTATSNGTIGIAQNVTAAQLNAAKEANLCISGQSNGTITVAALGTTPTIDIPVAVILN